MTKSIIVARFGFIRLLEVLVIRVLHICNNLASILLIPLNILLHNLLTHHLLLQNLLIANNIKYLFWNSSVTVPYNFSHYLNEINHKRFPYIRERQKSYTEILESKGFRHSPFAKWGHYGADSQEWFANYLKEYVTKNKLL